MEEVYHSVIVDLKAAEYLLDTAGVQYIPINRASEWHAMHILQEFIFQKGRYDNASYYANKVINSGNYSLNTKSQYFRHFQTTGNTISGETIMQIINLLTEQGNGIWYNYAPNDNTTPLFTA